MKSIPRALRLARVKDSVSKGREESVKPQEILKNLNKMEDKRVLVKRKVIAEFRPGRCL